MSTPGRAQPAARDLPPHGSVDITNDSSVGLRQVSTIVATIATALLFYLVVVAIIIERIRRYFLGWRAFEWPRFVETVDAFGYPVPLWMALVLLSILPGGWLASEIYFRCQRRHRDVHGLCPECGFRVKCAWRGKCPQCGFRLGPDELATRVRVRG